MPGSVTAAVSGGFGGGGGRPAGWRLAASAGSEERQPAASEILIMLELGSFCLKKKIKKHQTQRKVERDPGKEGCDGWRCTPSSRPALVWVCRGTGQAQHLQGAGNWVPAESLGVERGFCFGATFFVSWALNQQPGQALAACARCRAPAPGCARFASGTGILESFGSLLLSENPAGPTGGRGQSVLVLGTFEELGC